MGSSNSKNELVAPDEYDKMIGSGRFNSYLAALPSLLSEIQVEKEKYLCTAYVLPDYTSLVIACVDMSANYYEKRLSEHEIIEIRNKLNITGKISTGQYMKALKSTFAEKRIHVVFKEPDTESEHTVCSCTFEFKFDGVVGSQKQLVDLVKVDDPVDSLTTVFINPLSEAYQRRLSVDKAGMIEKQIKELEEQIAALQLGGNFEAVEAPAKIEVLGDGSPVGKKTLGPMLDSIRENLVFKDIITEKETLGFKRVMELLTTDVNFDAELTDTLDQEVIEGVKGFVSKGSSPVTSTNKNLPSILEIFERIDGWDFDVFTLDELTNGHVLAVTAYAIMLKHNFIADLNIDERKLINFLKEVERGYHPNPYHNAMHAADVLQVVHYTIQKGGLGEHLDDVEKFSVIFSAIVHDLDHPGLNNAFLVNSKNYLASLYNDRAVLESHHSSQAFEIMKIPECNILSGLDPAKRRRVRSTIVDIVLATDMGRHGKLVGKFKKLVEAGVDFKNKDHIKMILRMVIKMADINNLSRPTHLYVKWAVRIIDEFYVQGDKEKELNIPITPLMDRTKSILSKGQIAFANFVVIPMFQIFAKMLPKMRFLLDYINDQIKYWEVNEVVLEEHRRKHPDAKQHELLMDEQ